MNRATSGPARDHCLAPGRAVDAPPGGGRYTRLFPHLPPLGVDSRLVHALGRAGGACDSATCRRGESRTVAAGWPVFGQYVAHDITADRSPVTHHDDESLLRNVRSARLNLECLYGDGPVAQPYLYSRRDPAKLLLGRNDRSRHDDLPRNQEGTALVGDPRQDVHVLISQMQVAMIRAHNRLVDRLRIDGIPEAQLFAAARQALTWHYQWVVLHDFLPATIGRERTERLLAEGPRYVPRDQPVAIPLEFADAAYRYGHSQIRDTYRLRPGGPSLSLFPDLLGFRPVPADRVVDWRELLPVPGGPPPQRARPIDGRLPASLVHLPPDITGALDDADHGSLAVRDLLRGNATALPSGEAVARAVGAQPLTAEETRLADHGWAGETPLWYYVLKEAEAREDGERLGPVGALIVGEVLVRIVDDDPGSHRCVDPSWRPTLPSREPDRFTLADLLAPHPVAGCLPVGMSPATAGTSTSRLTQDVGHRTG
ncbi:MAG: peroxidase [Actinobacteria bacterium]|nr:MAG: peroxidase [Actinomycetota bacterium]